jgi:hypothetical protein
MEPTPPACIADGPDRLPVRVPERPVWTTSTRSVWEHLHTMWKPGKGVPVWSRLPRHGEARPSASSRTSKPSSKASSTVTQDSARMRLGCCGARLGGVDALVRAPKYQAAPVFRVDECLSSWHFRPQVVCFSARGGWRSRASCDFPGDCRLAHPCPLRLAHMHTCDGGFRARI